MSCEHNSLARCDECSLKWHRAEVAALRARVERLERALEAVSLLCVGDASRSVLWDIAREALESGEK